MQTQNSHLDGAPLSQRTAILVVGMHRSGTSAITRTISLMGAALPADLIPPGPIENPRGFWESASVIENHDRFLAQAGSRWDDPLPIAEHWFVSPAAAACRDEIVAILHRQVGSAPCFVIKDPRLCRLLPIWKSALDSMGLRTVAVLPVRDPAAVALSLRVRNGFSREKSLALWLVHSLLAERATRDWPRIFVRYDDFIADPVRAAKAMAGRLPGLPSDLSDQAAAEIREHWSSDLRHHQPDPAEAKPGWVNLVLDWFSRACGQTSPSPEELDKITEALAPALEVFGPMVDRHDPAREAELEQKLEELGRQLVEQRAEAVREAEAHHKLEQKSQALQDQLAEAQSDRTRQVGRSEALSQERDRLSQACEQLQGQRDELISAQNALRHERDGALSDLQRERGERDGALADLRRLAERQAQTLHSLRREQAGLQDQNAQLQAQLLDGMQDLARQAEEDSYRLALGARRPWVVESWPGGSGLRRLIEAARLLPIMLRPGLFDAGHYRKCRPDAPMVRWRALAHYLLIGRPAGASPNPFFDADTYLRRNLDVLAGGGDPWRHYLQHGGFEGRDPGPDFDSAFYLGSNPDVARARINPLRHYLSHGRYEGRRPKIYSIPPRPPARMPAPIALPLEETGHPRILFILHGLGGGVERHCLEMEALLSADGADVWLMVGSGDAGFRLTNRRRSYDQRFDDLAAVPEQIRRIAPDLLHVHQEIGFGGHLWDWLAELGIPYDVTLHDYSLACPRVTLLDGENRFCGGPRDEQACDECLSRFGCHPHLQAIFDKVGSVAGWRRRAAAALNGARRVFVPNSDMTPRLQGRFPDIAIMTRPHPEPEMTVPALPPPGGDRVRVAVIGSIGPHKGFAQLLACAKAALRDGLKLTFVVIGEVCDPRALANLPNVELSGAYRHEDLPALLEVARCHLALFLSVWPETFCYALSEALQAGLYPLAYDLGAPAERIRRLGWGEVMALEARPEEINRRLLLRGLDHPLPTSEMKIGKSYGSLIQDYYGLVREPG